jgi:hypothetical protein
MQTFFVKTLVPLHIIDVLTDRTFQGLLLNPHLLLAEKKLFVISFLLYHWKKYFLIFYNTIYIIKTVIIGDSNERHVFNIREAIHIWVACKIPYN